ncbi:hypothetical protein Tco_0479211 [Tanacetum coccineum]
MGKPPMRCSEEGLLISATSMCLGALYIFIIRVAKAFRVFNIRRQEMKETVHVTFSEDDEAISQTSIEGDAINFNENRSFLDDEFLEPRIKDTQCSANIEYFPYIPAYENTTLTNSPIFQDFVYPEEPPEFSSVDNHQAVTEAIPQTLVPQDRWLREKYIELVNIIGEPLAGIITRSRMDMKSAFLNEKISEEVYVQQPPRFESSEFPNHVSQVCQRKYDLADSVLVKCHMLPSNNLGPDESGVSVNETLFRGMIGSLMYLTARRPDIQFSTCLCLWYPKGSGFNLKAYSDSYYAGCNLDRKSTSEGSEAEYVADAGCCAQVLWIKSRLADYDVLYDKVPIFCDNTSVIAISNNPVLHSRTTHIDIRYYFIKDHILKGDIELHFVPTDLQLADIFIKPLAEPSFTRLVAELGMLNIKKQFSDKKKGLSDI